MRKSWMIFILAGTSLIVSSTCAADVNVYCPEKISCASTNIASCDSKDSRWLPSGSQKGVVAGIYVFSGGVLTGATAQAQCWYVNQKDNTYDLYADNEGAPLYVQLNGSWNFNGAKQRWECGTFKSPINSKTCYFVQKS